MKNTLRFLFCLLGLVCLVNVLAAQATVNANPPLNVSGTPLAPSVAAQLQPVAPDLAATAPNADTAKVVESFLPGILTSTVARFPWIATLIVFMGSMRVWAKPLVGFIHFVIQATASKEDDTWYDRITGWLNTPAGAWLNWILNYVCSINLVPPSKPADKSAS